jgi:hypothetical protein
MLSYHASAQIAADRRARAMDDAKVERTAGFLRRLRRHAPPVPLRRTARPEVREAEAA